MKIYTDTFKKPITQAEVRTAVVMILKRKQADPFMLGRTIKGFGPGKANTVIRLLEDAGVISEQNGANYLPRTILLKNEDAAINAALRQLKKGNS